MDDLAAEIEALKGRISTMQWLFREQVREIDSRDRASDDLRSDLTAAKGAIARMQTDRNAEE